MNNMESNQEKWDKIKQMEFLRKGGTHWMFDFTEQFNDLKRREEYDKIWKMIKNEQDK